MGTYQICGTTRWHRFHSTVLMYLEEYVFMTFIKSEADASDLLRVLKT